MSAHLNDGQITIRYFAWVREKTGRSEERIALPQGIVTVKDLIGWLKTRGTEFEQAFARPEAIRTALDRVGGEILFQMRVEDRDCQRVAAVRLGQGQEAEFALVIMPPGGGLMRVEPVAQSSNPLARITQSYAGLMDVFKAAA